MWGIAVIRIIVLGLICVGGVGAIAAATSKSAPVSAPSVVYPAVVGNKGDRLSLVSMQDIQPTVGQVALAHAPPSEPLAPAQPQPKEAAKAKPSEFVPRHWHDPNDTRVSARKPKAERSKSTSRNGSATKLADAQSCRTDGLGSLIRKLSSQPACDH